MGFNPNRTARLTFVQPEYSEAEVLVSLNVTVERYLSFQTLLAQELQDLGSQLHYFGDAVLKEWNLENDDGNPIPANYEGVKQVPLEFVSACIRGWIDAVGAVPDPLAETSPNGQPLAEALTEPVELLESLSSLSTPN